MKSGKKAGFDISRKEFSKHHTQIRPEPFELSTFCRRHRSVRKVCIIYKNCPMHSGVSVAVHESFGCLHVSDWKYQEDC
jgi:hypothetical protein